MSGVLPRMEHEKWMLIEQKVEGDLLDPLVHLLPSIKEAAIELAFFCGFS